VLERRLQDLTGSEANGAGAARGARPAPIRTTGLTINPRDIPKLIEQVRDLEELEAFVADHEESFTQLHVRHALLRLHRLAAAGQKDAGAGDGASEADDAADDWHAVGGGYGRAYRQSAAEDANQRDQITAAPPADYYKRRSLAASSDGGGRRRTPRSPLAFSQSQAIFDADNTKRQKKVLECVSELPSDPTDLFWFKKPKLLLFVSAGSRSFELFEQRLRCS
jgi:hypothetical protein